jgi:nucleoid DNA-binding protein
VAEIEKIMRNDFRQQISQRQGRECEQTGSYQKPDGRMPIYKKGIRRRRGFIFQQNLRCAGSGDRVEIRGLCSFFVKEYPSYQGRNPMTGETVQVPPKRLPFFKVGKELKKRVDY